MMVKQKVSQVLTSLHALKKKWHEFIPSKDGRDFIKSSGSNSRFILKQLLKRDSLVFLFCPERLQNVDIFLFGCVFKSFECGSVSSWS